MNFYNLESGTDIKEIISNQYKKMLESYSQQKESDEYKTVSSISILVEKFNFNQVQNILQSDSTAFCWLNIFTGKVYVNVKNKKGYKYNLKNNCLGQI